MRGGPFSATRVIELMNRRFVPFYFNTGGPGGGKDEAAAAFVLGKVPNRWAYFAAFAPDGEILSQTATYAGTEDVVAWLGALLERWPEYAKPTPAEAAVFAAATATNADPAARLAAATLHEQLCRHAAAAEAYRDVCDEAAPERAVAAWRGLLRCLRHRRAWSEHAAAAAAASSSPHAAELELDLVIENGHRAIAEGRYREARELLQPATKRALRSPRLGETHWLAGLACWFDGARDWAKLHWCWIVERLPDDRLFQRASVAAAAEVMPYPNHELGGFAADVGPVGPGIVQSGVRRARADHERLLPRYEAGDFGWSDREPAAVTAPLAVPPATPPLETPEALLVQLRDSAPSATAVRERLVAHGEPALAPLFTAAANPHFRGRRQAAATLPELLRACEARPEWLSGSLSRLAQDGDGEVARAAREALALVRESRPAPPQPVPPRPRSGGG